MLDVPSMEGLGIAWLTGRRWNAPCPKATPQPPATKMPERKRPKQYASGPADQTNLNDEWHYQTQAVGARHAVLVDHELRDFTVDRQGNACHCQPERYLQQKKNWSHSMCLTPR
jgi:hypothetical protein